MSEYPKVSYVLFLLPAPTELLRKRMGGEWGNEQTRSSMNNSESCEIRDTLDFK